MIASNVEKIAQLFPNCVTERLNKDGKPELAIDFDKLQAELSNDIIAEGEERYQFTWPDKRAAVRLANTPTTMTLRPCREESVDFDNTQNLYIEGDNLDVLKVLRETYLGKVKLIYIDPPYNTGNDFVYNDDFAQCKGEFEQQSGLFDEDGNQTVDPMQRNTESNGRFHTDWLNMMYPRLKVARDLLAADGAVFISIDDNEVENLKAVCNEIYGLQNFVGQITVVANPRGRDYGGIARMHDYILVYKKNVNNITLIKDPDGAFELFDELGGFELRELRNRNIKFNKNNRPNLYYPFYINLNRRDTHGLHEISLKPVEGWLELWPLPSQGVNTVWRWGKAKSEENININIKAKPMRNGSFMIVEKYREAKKMARSVWWDKESNTEKGTLLVKELMGGKVFDYPKPVEMIMRVCEMGAAEESSIILDFFSGSATTAHAVMQLNAEDGMNRRYIMVQWPEELKPDSEAFITGYKNLCEIAKERISRAGKKVKDEAGLAGQNLDIGFRVLKLDSSNMADVYYTPQEAGQKTLFDENVKPDRSNEDLLFQVMLDLGIELSAKIEAKQIAGKTVHFVDGNYLVACFDCEVNETTIKEIAQLHPVYFVMRDASAANDNVIDNFEQIFKHYSPDTNCRII